MFAFNSVVNSIVFTPAANIYATLTPKPLQAGVNNVFTNLDEIPTTANFILQANLQRALESFWRFVINGTIGVGGLFDPASQLGLKREHQDLGLTFAKWGIKESPYLVIPILGPSTVRDAVALPINYMFFNVYPHIDPLWARYSILAFNMVRLHAKYLPAAKLIKQSYDPYLFVRSAYLQHRNMRISGKTDASEKDEDTYVEELETEASS